MCPDRLTAYHVFQRMVEPFHMVDSVGSNKGNAFFRGKAEKDVDQFARGNIANVKEPSPQLQGKCLRQTALLALAPLPHFYLSLRSVGSPLPLPSLGPGDREINAARR